MLVKCDAEEYGASWERQLYQVPEPHIFRHGKGQVIQGKFLLCIWLFHMLLAVTLLTSNQCLPWWPPTLCENTH